MAKSTKRVGKRAGRKPRAKGPKSGGKRAVVWVGTKKGLWTLHSDALRRTWRVSGPQFLGHVVNHVVLDPRDGKTVLAGVRTGHLGPTVFRSSDGGRSWKEATTPPRFPLAPEGAPPGKAVKNVFWLTPGHLERPGEWWAGTVPHGLFRSKDGGVTWDECAGFSSALAEWAKTPGRVEEVPDGAITHSVLVDPRDPAHVYVGLSQGGFFESTDEGTTWRPLNRGVVADFLPEKEPEYGQDPHCVRFHPAMPDRLWQQNHCGFYLLERPSATWDRVGNNMPKKIGDVGFPVALHPRDTATAWTVPMDGTDVWPRTSVGGRPCVMKTADCGKSWKRQDGGFPTRAWWTVKRQSFCADAGEPAGLYLGTTSGEVWASRNEGDSWRCLARHLPHVLSVTCAPSA